MSPEEIRAAIIKLEQENQDLRAKKAKKNAPKISLPNVVDPDPRSFVSADDVMGMIVDSGIVDKADKADAYRFLRFFNLHPMAQVRKPDAKGVGKRLYMTGDVVDAINHLLAFPGVKKN